MDAERCDFCGHVRSSGEKFVRLRAELASVSTDRQVAVPLYEPFVFSLALCRPCADAHFKRDPEREEWL